MVEALQQRIIEEEVVVIGTVGAAGLTDRMREIIWLIVGQIGPSHTREARIPGTALRSPAASE